MDRLQNATSLNWLYCWYPDSCLCSFFSLFLQYTFFLFIISSSSLLSTFLRISESVISMSRDCCTDSSDKAVDHTVALLRFCNSPEEVVDLELITSLPSFSSSSPLCYNFCTHSPYTHNHKQVIERSRENRWPSCPLSKVHFDNLMCMTTLKICRL